MTESLAPRLGQQSLKDAGVDLGVEYEALIDMLADRLMRPGDIVIDGGANAGRHTIPFGKRVAPNGIVHAFEPMPDVIERNHTRARGAGLDDVIRYHAVGLSDTAGAADFFRIDEALGRSSLHERYAGKPTRRITVALETLDRLLPDEQVDFIKLDVEGAEFPALRGGAKLIARSKPFIVFENAKRWAAECFGYARDDLFSFFDALGLELIDGFGNDFAAEQWQSPHAGWYFCAFDRSRIDPAEYRSIVRGFWQDRLEAVKGGTDPSL